MNENLNKLKKGDLVNVSKTKSLIFGYDVQGEYLFDSNHDENICFVQDLNEPSGKRLMIYKQFIQ